MLDILLISNYKVESPISGGQRRTSAFKENLSKHFRVASLSLTSGKNNPSAGYYYANIERRANKHQYLYNHLTDFYFFLDATKDPTSVARMQKFLLELKPHIIQFEQPWAIPLVIEALRAMTKQPKLIYSSQNIEWELKKETLCNIAPDESFFKYVLTETEKLESFAAVHCDLTLAVSAQDAQKLYQMGAKEVQTIPNCAPFTPQKIKSIDVNRPPYLIFIGSNHPPNHSGFKEMVGNHLGFLPPRNGVLTVVGGVCNLIIDDPDFSSFWPKINSTRVDFHPTCPDSQLNNLIQGAAGVILPITQGGGTNLKTAEALLHDKPIVATSHAFRGFESFLTSPHVNISDNPIEFRAHMRKLLDTPRLAAGRSSSHLMKLTWENHISSNLNDWSKLLKD